jgi:hypothetical protein
MLIGRRIKHRRVTWEGMVLEKWEFRIASSQFTSGRRTIDRRGGSKLLNEIGCKRK